MTTDNLTTEGPAMTAPATRTAPASEITGIRSAITQLDSIAQAHARHAGDEGFLGSLNRMEVGEDDKQKVAAAQEASRNAGQLWKLAADEVRQHNDPVGQAYQTSPGAGNKAANTNE